ncbi:MAG: sigma-70 family RNA polymerase sigma factor [Anaerolineae bacterium]
MNATAPLSEEALLRAAKSGAAEAFQKLVGLHQATVLGFLYHMGNEPDAAQDLAQETFIKAWLALDSYEHRGQLKSWLLKIAYHTTIDYWRQQRPSVTLDEVTLDDGRPGLESLALQADRAELVRRAIRALPERSRSVIILREYHQLSYREIAATLDIPIGTVMSRLNYARSLLKNALQPLLEDAYA